MKRKIRWISIIMVLMLVLAACGAKKNSEPKAMYDNTVTSDGSPEGILQEDAKLVTEAGASDSGTDQSNEINLLESGRKLIRTINVTAETQEFDKMVKLVEEKINELGGYTESSVVDGNGYNNGKDRTCQFIARIPKDKLDAFVSSVSSIVNVINKTESAQDITLEYVDVESHKEALKLEYDRLLAILEKADKLEEIIALETRLAEVRYELNNYESQLRTFDNQVDYGTVTLTISEVERVTAVDNESTVDKMTNGIENTFYEISKGVQSFAIWFVVNLPYLIIWAIILAGVFFVVRRGIRKYDKRIELKEKENKEQRERIRVQLGDQNKEDQIQK